MYHIKKLKISAFAFVFSATLGIIYAGGSIILYTCILVVAYISNNFSLPNYMVNDTVNAEFLLGWLGVLLIVLLGAFGLGALIALIYNQFGKAGKGIQIDIELFK